MENTEMFAQLKKRYDMESKLRKISFTEFLFEELVRFEKCMEAMKEEHRRLENFLLESLAKPARWWPVSEKTFPVPTAEGTIIFMNEAGSMVVIDNPVPSHIQKHKLAYYLIVPKIEKDQS